MPCAYRAEAEAISSRAVPPRRVPPGGLPDAATSTLSVFLAMVHPLTTLAGTGVAFSFPFSPLPRAPRLGVLFPHQLRASLRILSLAFLALLRGERRVETRADGLLQRVVHAPRL